MNGSQLECHYSNSFCRLVCGRSRSEESAVVSFALKRKASSDQKTTAPEENAQWDSSREQWFTLRWNENQINQLISLSLSLSLPLPPPFSFSAVTPPLSPSVTSPPPRRLSLKRFSLFSRFPGKHSHGPKEGGRAGRRASIYKNLTSFFLFLSPSEPWSSKLRPGQNIDSWQEVQASCVWKAQFALCCFLMLSWANAGNLWFTFWLPQTHLKQPDWRFELFCR